MAGVLQKPSALRWKGGGDVSPRSDTEGDGFQGSRGDPYQRLSPRHRAVGSCSYVGGRRAEGNQSRKRVLWKIDESRFQTINGNCVLAVVHLQGAKFGGPMHRKCAVVRRLTRLAWAIPTYKHASCGRERWMAQDLSRLRGRRRHWT